MLGLAFVVFFGEVGLDVEAEVITVKDEAVEAELFEDIEPSSRGSTSSGDNRI